MTAIRTIFGRHGMIPSNSAAAKIMFSYLASHLTAIVVVGFFFAMGLFDGGFFSSDSLIMQLLSR